MVNNLVTPLKTIQKLMLAENPVLLWLLDKFTAGTLLWQLDWLPVHFLTKFKVLLLTLKALNGLEPEFLKTLLLPFSLTPKILREGPPLCVPLETKAKGAVVRGKAFLIMPTQILHSLLDEL